MAKFVVYALATVEIEADDEDEAIDIAYDMSPTHWNIEDIEEAVKQRDKTA